MPDLAFFPLWRFCLLMPLFVFSMILQVWTFGSSDGYLLGETIHLQEGHFFVYKGLFRACSWGRVCQVLVPVSSGRFDGVAQFCSEFVVFSLFCLLYCKAVALYF